MATVYVDLSAGTNGTGTSGSPYNSLANMQTGEDKDLVTRTEILTVYVKGSNTNVSWTMSGWTTSASYYLSIEPWPGFEGDGTSGSYPKHTSTSGHVFTLQNSQKIQIIGQELHQNGSGASDECIRAPVGSGSELIVKKCLIHSAGSADDQDGIHIPTGDCTLTVENSIIHTFRRAAICTQSGTATQTLNVDSCLFYNTNSGTAEGEGGLSVRRLSGTYTCTVNCYNTGSFVEGTGTSDGFNQVGAFSPTWTGTHNVCAPGDTSATGKFGSGNGNLNGVLITTTDQVGDIWLVTNLTAGSENFTPVAVSTGTEQCIDVGSTTLTDDMLGTARPQNIDDRGPIEFVSGAGTQSGTASTAVAKAVAPNASGTGAGAVSAAPTTASASVVALDAAAVPLPVSAAPTSAQASAVALDAAAVPLPVAVTAGTASARAVAYGVTERLQGIADPASASAVAISASATGSGAASATANPASARAVALDVPVSTFVPRRWKVAVSGTARFVIYG